MHMGMRDTGITIVISTEQRASYNYLIKTVMSRKQNMCQLSDIWNKSCYFMKPLGGHKNNKNNENDE